MAFARVKASSAQRGYGEAHKRARAAALAQHYDGAPCCLCGHPMYGPTRGLDLDHLPGTEQYRGLAHGLTKCRTCGKHCNRSDGGRRARASQTTTPPPRTSRRWR